MKVVIDTFDDGYAWWVVQDGLIKAQGYDTQLNEARRQAHSAAMGISLADAEYTD